MRVERIIFLYNKWRTGEEYINIYFIVWDKIPNSNVFL